MTTASSQSLHQNINTFNSANTTMTTTTPDAKSILHLMQNSIGYTGEDGSTATTEIKNPTEAAALFAHAMMLAAGFRLIGFNEDDRFGKHTPKTLHTGARTDVLKVIP